MEESRLRLERLMEAIDWERKAEESFFADFHEKKPLKEKVESGFAWYPVEISGVFFAAGDYLELKIKRKNTQDNPEHHRFKTGVSVQIFHANPQVNPVKGIVADLSKGTISILTPADPGTIEEFNSGLCGLEIIYDDKPYQVMKSAMTKVIQSKFPLVQSLQKVLSGKSLPEFWNQRTVEKPEMYHEYINDAQKIAIQQALACNFVSVIHGPPGTGKTTTLVALVQELIKSEKKVLVCASSNNAVDVLALRLHACGIRVLRVGNITKVHEAMTDMTVVEKTRNHPDWTTIKKMRIQADQLERQARQFKRNFTEENRSERKQLRTEAKEIKSWARELEMRISQEIIDEAEVIATTLISASHPLIEDLQYKTVVIDEASQALEPECWNAILKGERVILAGDHKQLPPVVKSEEARKSGLEITLLDVLTEHLENTNLLDIQYRMHEDILGFSNARFYQNKLISADHVKNRLLPGDHCAVEFIDTAGCSFDETINPKQKSYRNEGEFFILREYIEQKKEIFLGASIGIISPYAEQVRYLTDEMAGDIVFSDLDIEQNTIDGFQGQEKDVMFISLVRSNETGEIGFLKDERRLNVALTRARKKLVVIGDSATIGQHEVFIKFIEYVELCGGFDSAWNYMKY